MKKYAALLLAAAMMTAPGAMPGIYGQGSPITAQAYTKLKAPQGLTYTSEGNDRITLSWGQVSGADGYAVYSYNSSSKKWTKIASTKKTYVKLSNLSSGKKYYFLVAALDKVNNKYYRGEASEYIKVQYNYSENTSGQNNSSAIYIPPATTSAQESAILENYYKKNLSISSGKLDGTEITETKAVIAGARKDGRPVMLVYYTMKSGQVLTYGYVVSDGVIYPVPTLSADSESIKVSSLRFVKEEGSQKYYIRQDVGNSKGYTVITFYRMDGTKPVVRYEITSFSGAFYYLDGENSDTGSCEALIDSFKLVESNEEITVLT